VQTIQLISLRHSAFYTPYLITFVGDFLQKQNLKAVYRCVENIDELEAALLSGEAHVAQSAVGISMRQISMANKKTESKLRHFAQINKRDGFFIASSVMTGKEKAFTLKNLEGKRIIADHLFQPMAMLKYVLDQHAVDTSSIDFIDVGNAEQSVDAFLAGEAEYLHLQGPYPQQLVADGQATIVASVGESLGDIAYSSLCATKSWLKSPVAVRFITAYKAALHYVQQSRADILAEQIVGQFNSISLKTLTATIDSYKKMGSWSLQACISESDFQSANRVFLFSGDITTAIEYDQVITRQLCGDIEKIR